MDGKNRSSSTKKLEIVIKNKLDSTIATKSSNNAIHKTTVDAEKRLTRVQWIYGVLVGLSLNLVLQAAVSTSNHSGMGKPPTYGDYEAQRHWMEITVNLPVSEWYFNTTNNDLYYWGLDYPPVTAYHSWFLGKISYWLNPEWVALHTSRGLEVPAHKLFMRASVIIGTFSVYTTAILFLYNFIYKQIGSNEHLKYLFAILCYPGIIFVDNGHFQFNHISLGLFLWSVYFFHANRYIIGSIFYVLALNYKQMELSRPLWIEKCGSLNFEFLFYTLYHALPIFAFLLSRSMVHIKEDLIKSIFQSLKNLAQLGIAVIIGFGLIWLPFLIDSNVAKQVLARIFPFDRGLFEDKVANFWCSISIIIKIKELYDKQILVKISALLVLSSSLPSLWILFRRSSAKNFRLCLVITSLAFYLFSFQVHEKSILLCTIPALFLLNDFPNAVLSFLITSIYSLYHLCIKDENFEILALFFVYSLFLMTFNSNKLWKYYHVGNLISLTLICLLMLLGSTPQRYPHLYEVLLAVYCCLQFSLFFIYLNFQLIYCNYFISLGKNKKE